MPLTMQRDEMISILEEIARDGSNGAARISAIKQLDEMRREDEGTGDDSPFADLDEGVTDLRRYRVKRG